MKYAETCFIPHDGRLYYPANEKGRDLCPIIYVERTIRFGA